MANLIKLKRSAVPGKVPLPGDLDDGELALNTADAKLYLKKSDNTIAEISGGGGGFELYVEIFEDGTDYTAGSTTSLVITEPPLNEEQIQVSFNGVVQHHDTYSISGSTITFSSPIPTGVTTVEVQYVVNVEPNSIPLVFAVSDETTDLTTGTSKLTFRMPYAFTITDVRASVNEAPVGANIEVDVNEGGVSIFSTILSIDAGEKTSVTAATPAVISDANIADDAEISIDIDQVGSTTAGAGLKVTIYGVRSV